jgi:protein ImuA
MRTYPRLEKAAAGVVLPLPSATAPVAAPALRVSPPERLEARALIARLREHIARSEDAAFRLEQGGRGQRGRDPRPRLPWTLGLAEVDRHLPEAGLARAGLHDISPAAYGDFPAACGFALALAARRLADAQERRPLLWCRLETEVREYGRSYGYGLARLGLPRSRFLTVTLRKPVAVLWTLEEALKSGALALVMGDVAAQQFDLTGSRRLALAGQDGRACGLVVFNRNYMESTAGVSRWCVATSTSRPAGWDPKAPGPPAWQVALTRIRSGRPGDWTLSWQKDHASHHFTLVSKSFGGALHPGAAEGPGAGAAPEPALRAG